MRRTSLWLAVAQAFAFCSNAQDIIVTTTADTDAGFCTLRDAIASANADMATGGCVAGSGDDVISFSLTPPTTIVLSSPLPDITTPVDIRGPGMDELTIDFNQMDGLFVGQIDFLMSDVTLENARREASGGALHLNRSNGTLTRVRIQDSTATLNGGGIFVSSGSLTLSEAEISNNVATGSGGGVSVSSSVLIATDSTVSGNMATAGGAIHSGSLGSVSGSSLTLTNNAASSPTPSEARGGAVFHEGDSSETIPSFVLTGSTISGNSAVSGGGMYLRNSSAQIADSTISQNEAVDGGGLRLRNFAGVSTPVLDTVLIEGNTASYSGGGAWITTPSLEVVGSIVSANSAGFEGGGLDVYSESVSLRSTSIVGNTSGDIGGGVAIGGGYGAARIQQSVVSHNVSARAAGIRADRGEFTIEDSTVYGNTGSFDSGAIYASRGSLTITNSTISENVASAYSPSGIRMFYGNVELVHTTLATNSGSQSAIVADYADFVLTNSIVVSADSSCIAGPNSSITTSGNNHFSDDSCGGVAAGDPLLADVASNGGPTPTQAPQTASPVINAGDLAFCEDTDQRGELRSSTVCDLGAFEVVSFNNPPRVDDQRFLVFTPVSDMDSVGVVAYSDPDLPLPPGSARLINDGGQFTIQPNGEIVIDSPMPAAGEFDLYLEVTDPGGLSDRATIRVSIQDQAAPEVADSVFDLADDAQSGTLVGVVSISDANEDLAIGGVAIIAGDPNGLFAISDAGELTLLGSGGLDSTYTLTVEATDNSGLTGTGQVIVRVGEVIVRTGFENE